MSYLATLNKQLEELKSFMPYTNKITKDVSQSSVGWQIFHILKVINLIATAIKKSDAKNYIETSNEYKSKFFEANYFPRGVAKAPKFALPPESFNSYDLEEQLNLAKQSVMEIAATETNANFEHFIFGVLNKKESEQFLTIHTEHHLKIIREILAKS